MRDDVIFSLIKYDKLLVVYGNAMCMKYRSRHHYDMIKNRLRIMGRFLQVAKSVNPAIDDFASLYQPPIFDTIIEVLHQFGNYDKISGYYEKPTLPSTIGTALKYIANLYIMECIKSRDEKQKKDVEDVLVLLKTGLQGPVNKTAAESLLHQKRQKKEVLPLTEDVRKLNAYITSN
ncbi:uncharacterized protein LOC108916693 [Anoplophora glabripennis]|nr:uncharacterized protein LOC108916693 [Anoplophora glabripennis]